MNPSLFDGTKLNADAPCKGSPENTAAPCLDRFTNEHEAANARRKLSALLTEHGLSWNDLPAVLADLDTSSTDTSDRTDTPDHKETKSAGSTTSGQEYPREPDHQPRQNERSYGHPNPAPKPFGFSGRGRLFVAIFLMAAAILAALLGQTTSESSTARKERERQEILRQQDLERRRQQEAELKQHQVEAERQRQQEAERQRQQDVEHQQQEAERRRQEQRAAQLRRLDILRCLNGNGTCCPLGQTPTSVLNLRTNIYEMRCREVRFGE